MVRFRVNANLGALEISKCFDNEVDALKEYETRKIWSVYCEIVDDENGKILKKSYMDRQTRKRKEIVYD